MLVCVPRTHIKDRPKPHFLSRAQRGSVKKTGDLDRYENPQTMVINWAQDAFGGKEQIALLMQQVGRPCALADADQQDAADTLAEAGEAPVGVSLQDGYLLVNFTGWTAE